MPRELDTSKLKAFSPKPKNNNKPLDTRSSDPSKNNAWPSRESIHDGQFTIRGPVNEINRFRDLCKNDRRTYADMLRILMDSFEKNSSAF